MEITNIINLYDYFKDQTKYKPLNWSIAEDTIQFNKINYTDLINIIEIILNYFKINKMAYYNNYLMIQIK